MRKYFFILLFVTGCVPQANEKTVQNLVVIVDSLKSVSSYDDIEEQDREQYENDEENIHGSRIQFAYPGGKSTLRVASKNNPRNLPCPNCGEPNRLTPEDRAHGYQCDECANQAEGGF